MSVYVVCEPVAEKEARQFELAPVRQWGEIRPVMCVNQKLALPAQVGEIRRALTIFCDKDYLLLASGPLFSSLVTTIAAEKTGGVLQFLIWDPRTRLYLCDTLNLFPNKVKPTARQPKAKPKPKTVDRVAAKIGIPLNPGTYYARMVKAMLRSDVFGKTLGATLPELIAAADMRSVNPGTVQARLIELNNSHGIGYRRDDKKRYFVVAPENLTLATIVRPDAVVFK